MYNSINLTKLVYCSLHFSFPKLDLNFIFKYLPTRKSLLLFFSEAGVNSNIQFSSNAKAKLFQITISKLSN